MANYRFNDSHKDKSSNEIWRDLQNLVYVNREFYSVGKALKTYKITSKNNEAISFSGAGRINIEDFVNVLDKLLKLDTFNTNNSKAFFKGTSLCSKRSPYNKPKEMPLYLKKSLQK